MKWFLIAGCLYSWMDTARGSSWWCSRRPLPRTRLSLPTNRFHSASYTWHGLHDLPRLAFHPGAHNALAGSSYRTSRKAQRAIGAWGIGSIQRMNIHWLRSGMDALRSINAAKHSESQSSAVRSILLPIWMGILSFMLCIYLSNTSLDWLHWSWTS